MRLVALIPARYGSTRFPGKPLALIAGKPLIQRVWEQARQVKELDGLWVATDEARIRDCVEGFGGQAVMTRADHPSGSDRLAEAAHLLDLAPEDIVVNIQGDQPLFPLELIAKLAAPLRRDPEAVMVTPARKITDPEAARRTPTWSRWSSTAATGPSISPAAPCPAGGTPAQPYFYRHLGIYAYRVGFLQEFVHLAPGRWEEAEKLEQLRALEHGYPIHIVETAGDTLEVDTPADLARAEAYFAPGS